MLPDFIKTFSKILFGFEIGNHVAVQIAVHTHSALNNNRKMFDFIMAYMPYKTAHIDAMHRRLATPNYTDVLVITGLSCFLLFLLYKLIQKMDIWTRYASFDSPRKCKY